MCPHLAGRPVLGDLFEEIAVRVEEETQPGRKLVDREAATALVAAGAIAAGAGVKVLEVRTISVKSKPKRRGQTAGRTRTWKKAIVQVRPGDTIPIFQGLEGLEG